MNLIIDIGNTLVKFAVFQEGELLKKYSVDVDGANEAFNTILKTHSNLRKAIISAVGNTNPELFETIDAHLDVLILSNDLHLPFKNSYKTPDTLGVDRIALASAAVQKFPERNVLVIDAGTCITYDFINAQNEYLGGSISPGISLRYKALHNYTAKLPLLQIEMPKTLIGNTTANAIHSGVVFGIIKEVDGIIDEYRVKHEDLTVILTGGDVNFLSKQLKNSIFANSNFLLEGLNYILEFNSH